MVTFKFDGLGDGNAVGITHVIGDDENGVNAQAVERDAGQVAVVKDQKVSLHQGPETIQDAELEGTEVVSETGYKPTDGLTM